MTKKQSFPARGTWIEIIAKEKGGLYTSVVPREGNVD